MANETRNQLKQAYAYIEQERLDEALMILRRVLSDDPDNADAWWLMANAVSEPADAAEALSNVLRLRPNHTEAREAYDQLIAEYPDLAPSQTTEVAFDVSDFNIDDLLAQAPAAPPSARPARTEEDFGATAWSMAETDATKSDLDLDALFGGKASIDVPVTPTEEEDLTAIFGASIEPAPAATSVPFESAPEWTPDFEDFSPPEEPLPDLAEPTEELEALFGAPSQPQSATEPSQSTAALEADLDAIFSGEPAFVGQIDQQEEKQRGRRGRRKKEQQPTTFAEAYEEPEAAAAPTQPVAAEPERERRKPQRLAPEEPAYDPYAAERRANKRSPIWAILSLMVVVAIVVGLMLAVLSSLAPDPVAQALRDAQQRLTERGFAQAAADRQADTFRLSVCGDVGRGLQSRVYEAMELVADHVAAAGEAIKTVQLTVTDCADATVILYRATAPAEAVRRYLEGGRLDVRAYRASWQ